MTDLYINGEKERERERGNYAYFQIISLVTAAYL